MIERKYVVDWPKRLLILDGGGGGGGRQQRSAQLPIDQDVTGLVPAASIPESLISSVLS